MAGQHQPTTVGIDLGTTYSCVAVFRRGGYEVIANGYSDRVTPSCVAFDEGQRIVGKEARANAYMLPRNTIFAVKRIIGRKFDDPEVQLYKSKWPLSIVSANGIPQIAITDSDNVNGQTNLLIRHYTAEDISSFILREMRTVADDFLSRGPDPTPLEAVITVPASFSDSQRRSTKAAGQKAGLKVLAVINEPTAAAVAYGLNKIIDPQIILVFDLGGGTLDVSILRLQDGRKFEVLSTAGNSCLGGEDFDERLLNHCIDEFEAKHNVRVDRGSQGVAELRLKVENAKKSFSSQDSKTVISVPAFHQTTLLFAKISKVKFDELCADLFQKTLEPVQEALHRAGLQKTDIGQIVLVGGCSRLLKVRDILASFFVNQPISKDINADEAIACGASILAHQLANESSSAIEEDQRIQFTDVTPASLGTEIAGGFFAVLVPQNTKIPAKESRIFTTERNGQHVVDIPVYEGEDRVARNNRLLGHFRFNKFQRGRAGEPQIEVIFEYDRSGIVHVTAKDQRTGRSATVHVDRDATTEDTESDDSGVDGVRERLARLLDA